MAGTTSISLARIGLPGSAILICRVPARVVPSLPFRFPCCARPRRESNPQPLATLTRPRILFHSADPADKVCCPALPLVRHLRRISCSAGSRTRATVRAGQPLLSERGSCRPDPFYQCFRRTVTVLRAVSISVRSHQTRRSPDGNGRLVLRMWFPLRSSVASVVLAYGPTIAWPFSVLSTPYAGQIPPATLPSARCRTASRAMRTTCSP